MQSFPFYTYTQNNWKWELKQYLYTHVHSSIIHRSQKLEATKVTKDRYMDE